MLKKYLLLFAILLVNPCWAEMPISANCGEFKGRSLEIDKNNKLTDIDDKIPKLQTFIFSYNDKKIFSDLGDTFSLMENSQILGIAVYPQSTILITFFPEKNKAIMTKHSDYTNIFNGIWAVTLIADCNFNY